MKIGRPAWSPVIVTLAVTAGSAWRREWMNVYVFGSIAVVFALLSLLGQRELARGKKRAAAPDGAVNTARGDRVSWDQSREQRHVAKSDASK